jgi:hypothetical protein
MLAGFFSSNPAIVEYRKVWPTRLGSSHLYNTLIRSAHWQNGPHCGSNNSRCPEEGLITEEFSKAAKNGEKEKKRKSII